MRCGRSWWRGRSLRARLTLLATAAVATGLVAGAALLLTILEHTQMAALDSGAMRTGRDVAALVGANQLPDPVPVGGTAVVQVIDGADRVVAASATGDHLVPVLPPGQLDRLRAGERLTVPGERFGVADRMRVLAVAAGRPEDPQTVVVAVSQRDVQRGLEALHTAMLVSTPTLLGLLALLSWYLVGRALRPVEALRASAEEIRGAPGARQLPVPAARDELHRLAVTLNDMLARLAAASQRQRGFVSDAAHELRSPIASIRTQLEVGRQLGNVAEFTDGVLADAERLRLLVDDLLLLARLDEGLEHGPDRLPRREPVALHLLARDLVGGYAGARVPVSVVGEPAHTEGDPERLRRVLANLLDNAVRHARSAVTVRTDTGPRWVGVLVTDDGPGVPAEQQERVFDRFTRLDDARARSDGGAGLGLSIVRELVRAHGGTVGLEDAGPGLRVVVRLPARR